MESVPPLTQGKEHAQSSDAAFAVRLAEPTDVLDILYWRNDAHTRLMSRNDALIEENQHRAWYARALKDPDRLLLVGTYTAGKIGIVRFDRYDLAQWEVNIVVAPEMRGQGFGRHLLGLAIRHFFSLNPEASLLADIKEQNRASHRLFCSLGFACETDDGGELVRYRLLGKENK